MSAALIQRHIRRLPKTKIFTTREVLQYGTRGSVDQALYRMVKTGFIVRLARGVFVKDVSLDPTLEEIARAKAAGFGKKLLQHPKNKLVQLKLASFTQEMHFLFAVHAHSSSFQTRKGRAYLQGIGIRKARLCETAVGQVACALWSLGIHVVESIHVSLATKDFLRSDREEFRLASSLMPGWLNDICMFRYARASVS